MSWFADMVWPLLLGTLLGLAIGWFVWRRRWRRSEENHCAEMRSLRRARDENEERIESLTVDLAERARSARDLTGEVATLREELNRSTLRHREAEEELESLRRSSTAIADLERRLAGEHNQKQVLAAERAAALGRVEEREIELRDFEVRSTTLQRELAGARLRVGELESALRERVAVEASLQSALERATADSASKVVELRGFLGARDERLGMLEASVAENEVREVELEAELAERSERMTALETDLAARNREMSRLQAMLGDRSGRIDELEREVSEREDRLRVLKGEVAERDSSLSDELAKRRAEQREVEAQLIARDRVIAARDSVVTERDARLQEMAVSMSANQAQVIALESELSQRRARVSEVERLLKEREARVSEVESQLDALTSEHRFHEVDDLEEISGIGPNMHALLNDRGVTAFGQLALLDEDGVEALEQRIGAVPGRVKRDDWVPQAADLHLEHHGEDLRERVVIARSDRRAGLASTGAADFFEASLLRSLSERPDLTPDELPPIKGIGRRMSRMLRKNGLTTFYQLARLDDAAVDDLETRADLVPGRIRTENWIPQAAQHHLDVHGEDIRHLVTVERRYTDALDQQLALTAQSRPLDYVDDLQRISGVGPKMEKLLHRNGLTTFIQVALLDDAGVAALNDRLNFFPGRIERDGWVAQAARLHEEYHGEDIPDSGV